MVYVRANGPCELEMIVCSSVVELGLHKCELGHFWMEWLSWSMSLLILCPFIILFVVEWEILKTACNYQWVYFFICSLSFCILSARDLLSGASMCFIQGVSFMVNLPFLCCVNFAYISSGFLCSASCFFGSEYRYLNVVSKDLLLSLFFLTQLQSEICLLSFCDSSLREWPCCGI